MCRCAACKCIGSGAPATSRLDASCPTRQMGRLSKYIVPSMTSIFVCGRSCLPPSDHFRANDAVRSMAVYHNWKEATASSMLSSSSFPRLSSSLSSPLLPRPFLSLFLSFSLFFLSSSPFSTFSSDPSLVDRLFRLSLTRVLPPRCIQPVLFHIHLNSPAFLESL